MALFGFMLMGCSDSKKPDESNSCPLSAKVDNADFCGIGHFAHDVSTGVLTIQASNASSGETIQFTINHAATGTFPFEEGVNFGAYIKGTSVYMTSGGSLVITRLDSEFVEGSFTFEAILVGQSETKSITNGKYKVPNLF